MKKTLIAAASMMLVSGFAANVMAADGTISFTGAVTDTSCVVQKTMVNVEVPPQAITKLAHKGDKGPDADFTLGFSECPKSKGSVLITFDKDQVTLAKGSMIVKNDAENLAPDGTAAKDISLEVVSGNVNEDGMTAAINSDGTALMGGSAHLIATSDNATAGIFANNLQYTVTYK